MTIRTLMTCTFTAFLAACAIPNQPLSAEEQNQLAPVECHGEVQCTKMWQRAQLWIAKNSAYKIQMANDVVIETYNPREHDVNLGFSLVKEPKGGDMYEINSRAGCSNMWGCRPHPNKARAALHRFIRETPP